MPARFLIGATEETDGQGKTLPKGRILGVREIDVDFGGKETLPRFIQATITNRSVDQVHLYFDPWKNLFTYSAAGSVPGVTVDYQVSIHDNAVSVFGLDAEFKQEARDFIETPQPHGLGGTLVSVDVAGTAYTFQFEDTVLDPFDRDLARIRLEDSFSDHFKYRYIFGAGFVNTIVAGTGGAGNPSPGVVEGTDAALTQYITDRLA